MSGAYVTVARVVRTQGRHGEVACEILTDFPEKFAERRRLFAFDGKSARRELQVEDHWPHKGRIVLKFAGVESIGEAEELLGWTLEIPLEERAAAEAGSAFVSDLVGCAVSDAKAGLVGTVTGVRFYAGDAPLLVVESEGGRERLIPYAERFLRSQDLEARRIEMELPEGLLDLDAPSPEGGKKKAHKPR